MRYARVVLLIVLLAAPPVLAHAGDDDSSKTPRAREREEHAEIPEGYTGPAREPYLSFFQGVWLYGQMSATAINEQIPVDLDVDGDWVVWEDSRRGDIFAYSISAGQGFYVTSDGPSVYQRRPSVSGNVVVYEDHRSLTRPAIYAYFLETGEARRISDGTHASRDPDIDYPIVAWVDDNRTTPDIWGYSLLNNTAWTVHDGTDRDSDPIVVQEVIYWRSYRYNLFDMVGYDTRADTHVQVTGDSALESSPFTNGEHLFFLTRGNVGGWTVDRFDPVTEMVSKSRFFVPDTSRSSASGDALLRTSMEMDYSQLVIRNITSGATNHVSGNLLLHSDPVLQGRTIFASVQTKEGTTLLQLQVSPFALAKRPSLTIASPSTGAIWARPTVVAGVLQSGPAFTEPTTFTYRVDDQPPQLIPAAERWRFTLDPNGVEPGSHSVTVRATFREGPPVTTTILLSIPAPSQSVDVARAGPAFHAARLMSELNAYVLDNPASWVILPLALLIVALLILRIWLWIKPRRRAAVAEYVTPEGE